MAVLHQPIGDSTVENAGPAANRLAVIFAIGIIVWLDGFQRRVYMKLGQHAAGLARWAARWTVDQKSGTGPLTMN